MSRNHPTESAADPADRAALLSMLADGESDAEAVHRGCRLWRDDADSRATWHAYQLIGVVLRSDEPPTPAGRDEAFLSGPTQRLAQ